eukprot:TRINITY_DN6117_c0_g1_i1.p1 TRINITY_DN6117_c0_g1~~TRINITY_DN6117_c0_g1_i1.p1  ORF type:complete len:557 (-),score=123.15 TRINITY_DN6117_c0_g1_i1:93-1682(-)
MRSFLFIGTLLLLIACSSLLPSVHAVWPQPSSASYGTEVLAIDPASFVISSSSGSQILQDAIQRYQALLFPFNTTQLALRGVKARSAPKPSSAFVSELLVNVGSDSEVLQLYVNEDYVLQVNSSGATLSAATVFGALRGLESFSQLVEWDSEALSYSITQSPVSINDSPRFPWRGLLLDTSRHYLPISTILREIDALAYNKFNTLHWHIVDAESFPIVSTAYPLLSEKGAYAPSAVYTPQDVQMIVQYALARGIRVVPEFDVPGHSYSWGFGYPELVAVCPYFAENINNIPLDPTKDFTYQVVEGVFGEMSAAFIDSHFHIGGDELVLDCWAEDANITQWMKQNNVATLTDLWQYFETKVTNFLTAQNKTIVTWQEVFNNGINVPPQTIFQVWEDFTTLQEVVNAGHYALMSSPYYLDKQVPVAGSYWYEWLDTWISMYQVDPAANITNNAELILGGEAAMWSEQVDSLSIDERIWPRASAVGERLWSPVDVTNVTDATLRLNQFRCGSLARRGIASSPVFPDYCELPF